ncbi:MAG: LLM class flavin-dependent oxidoreductase, partial [Alphaproteobacteria bacterium]|nr:LLM class flavin-dependent oxidoreductase [Alphaproteobacteria bacterium]
GVFYEHQIPRPWNDGDEHRLFKEALDEVELADRLGIDYAWEVEHHFLEEYSHSSAPEVFLAACSQRTKNIRLGHGIVLMPPGYNHPARVAERIATLDLVSDGRVEFGTGESSAAAELAGFGVSVEAKREMWRETTEQCANLLTMDPYPGFEGKYFSMPCRNLVPKPLQRPHPPIWVACSRRETIHMAARAGVGALTFAFVDPAEAVKWVGEYYDIIKSDACVPIGHAVNANIAMVTGFSCHPDEDEARARGLEGFQFFGYALGHHYIFGDHTPGRTDIWQRFQAVKDSLPTGGGGGSAIGTPGQLRERLALFADAGVDQVIFIQQSGRNRHDHICQSLELFAAEVMPTFKDGEAEREARKAEELAPYVEAALARKPRLAALAEGDIPVIHALGRQIAESGDNDGKPASLGESVAIGQGSDIQVPTRDPAAGGD